MTNAALQALIDEYGKRIFSIRFDNDRQLLIGYDGTPSLDDISLETVGGVDFLKVKNKNTNNGLTVEFFTLHVTSIIQSVGIMEDGFEGYGVDPFSFR